MGRSTAAAAPVKYTRVRRLHARALISDSVSEHTDSYSIYFFDEITSAARRRDLRACTAYALSHTQNAYTRHFVLITVIGIGDDLQYVRENERTSERTNVQTNVGHHV